MRPCWLLITTKGLRGRMPPEDYLERGMAAREARRWIETLSRRQPPEDPLKSSPHRLGDRVLMHVVETSFVEPWRACPLWVGVRWSAKSYPRLRVELIAADSSEAAEWVFSGSKSALDPSADHECRLEASFERRTVPTYVAAHRVKRFSGF